MNAHVETLRELLRTGDLSDWHSLDPALQAAIAALEAQGEAVAWISDGSLAMLREAGAGIVSAGRTDYLHTPLYLAPPSSPAMRAVVEALRDLRSFEYFRGVIHQFALENRCLCEKCIESRADSALAHPEVKKLIGEGK